MASPSPWFTVEEIAKKIECQRVFAKKSIICFLRMVEGIILPQGQTAGRCLREAAIMNHPFDAASSAARHGTLASSVYERLRQDVLTGELLPGHKLRIDALRLRYGVGASPVREALNRLVSEGLVTLEDQKGFRVAPVSLDELRELTHTRCLIN